MINGFWWAQAALTIAEIAGAYWFISQISEESMSGWRKWVELIGTGILAGLSIYQRSGLMYSRIWLIYCILFSCTLMTICHKEKRGLICATCAVYFETLYCLDLFLYIGAAICFFNNDFRSGLLQIGVERVGVYLIARGIMAVLLIFFYKNRKKAVYYFKAGGVVWVIVLAAEHFSLIICDRIFIFGLEKSAVNGWKILLPIYPLLLLLLALYFIQQKYRIMYGQMKIQNTLYYNQYKILERKSREKDSIYHDFRNHLVTLQKYATDGNVIQIQNYLQKLLKNEVKEEKPRTCHSVLDYLLQVKISDARQKDIQVEEEYECWLHRIDEDDLVDWSVLLGNIWDNAIEGCERVEGIRSISFTMKQTGNLVAIKMANSCLPNMNPKRLKTSKKDSRIHGIGLQNIEYVVNRHKGLITQECREGKFLTKILMII